MDEHQSTGEVMCIKCRLYGISHNTTVGTKFRTLLHVLLEI